MVSQSNNSVPSFVKAHYEIFGLTERGLRNKTRISDALDNNKFDSKTVDLLKHGKITQKDLLDKLRKIENRRIIKDKLKESLNPVESNSIENIHNKIKTFETSIIKGIGDRFNEAGKNNVRKRNKQKKIKKPSAKKTYSKTDAVCAKDKDELPIKELNDS